jgi:hypothetical protein
MTALTGRRRKSKRDPLLTPALIVSIVALLASVISIYLNLASTRDSTKSQAIREAYGTFFDLARLQLGNPQQSHLFAVPRQYPEVRSAVAASVQGLSSAQKVELSLKERAVADYVFTLYEQNLYLRRQADAAGDEGRSQFLGEVEAYLTGRLLRNPRLLFYWRADGGGLSDLYEEDTKKHHREKVATDKQVPLTEPEDAAGPFHTGSPLPAGAQTGK